MSRLDAGTDVAVVGGGAVGLCTAIYLAEAGRAVTLFDSDEVGRASTGNAGMIVPSHVVPLASPGVMAKGIRWLMSRDSPLYIKPRWSWELLRWLLQFRRACSRQHVERSIPALRDLSLASVDLFDELSRREGLMDIAYRNSGLLMLYHSEKGRSENLAAADLAEAAGLDVARLGASEVLERDPGIKARIDGGVWYPQDGCVDPDRFVSALRTEAERLGVLIRGACGATGFESEGDRLTAVNTRDGLSGARDFVVAAGAWSAEITRRFGLRLLMQPAKGYSLTIDVPERTVSVPHILTEEKLTVTPMPGRLRFAGTLSLSGFDGEVDSRRVAPINRLARSYLPDAPEEPDVWFGYRPCSPDGLPYIGRDPRFGNLWYATGHGMLGITHAPISGKLVTEMVCGEPPRVDVAAFAPERLT